MCNLEVPNELIYLEFALPLCEMFLKVDALWFKCFIVFLENLVSGTFICADNESKIQK